MNSKLTNFLWMSASALFLLTQQAEAMLFEEETTKGASVSVTVPQNPDSALQEQMATMFIRPELVQAFLRSSEAANLGADFDEYAFIAAKNRFALGHINKNFSVENLEAMSFETLQTLTRDTSLGLVDYLRGHLGEEGIRSGKITTIGIPYAFYAGAQRCGFQLPLQQNKVAIHFAKRFQDEQKSGQN